MLSPPSPEIDTSGEPPPTSSPSTRHPWMPLLLVAVLGVAAFWGTTGNETSSVLWTFVSEPDPSIHADSLVARGDGFAFLTAPRGDGVTLWGSLNGLVWTHQTWPGSATRLVAGGEDLWAFAGSWIELIEGSDPIRLDLPYLVRAGYGSGRAGLVAGPRGVVGLAFTGDVFWSDGLGDFQRVVTSPAWGEATGMPAHNRCDPPTTNSVDVPPLVATDDGFYVLISAEGEDPFGMWPVCEPEVWWSSDGLVWKRLTRGSPFGEGAFVYDLEWREGKLVAVGGIGLADPLVWTSGDGSAWRRLSRLPGEMGYQLREIAAGELGWLILGDRTDHAGSVGWVSPDGSCWVRIPDHIAGREAAVGNDRIVIAEQGSFPLIWVGVPSGGRSLGCQG